MNVTDVLLSKFLQVQNGWSVGDRDQDLVLVHYNEDFADLSQVGHLRGTVIDIAAEKIVCSSYPHIPIAATDKITLLSDGSLNIIDIMGYAHKSHNFQIKLDLEGPLLRVFKWKGKVYYSDERRLDCQDTHWGMSKKSYMEIYQELGGPLNLFPEDVDYSPWCYVFSLMHPELLMATRQNVGRGYLALLTINKMWDDFQQGQESPGPPVSGPLISGLEGSDRSTDARWNNIDHHPPAKIIGDSEMPAVIRAPFVYFPKALSIEQVNTHLKSGYYEAFPTGDDRTQAGEAVMVYKYDDMGKIEGLLKVQSFSYTWRTDIRQDNPDILRRFYELWGFALPSIVDEEGKIPPEEVNPGLKFLKDRFAMFPLLDLLDRPYEVPSIVPPEGPPPKLTQLISRDVRFRLIWANYVFALPLSQQEQAQSLLEEFFQVRERLIRWIVSLNKDGNILSNERYSQRLRGIIKIVRTSGDTTYQKAREIILSERGIPLFLLVEEMSKFL